MAGNEGQHNYFTQIPNIIDDWGLSTSSIRLYMHIKRVAGDNGVCTESQSTLAKICRMTGRTIVKAKKELFEKGLIKIDPEIRGGHPAHVIHIVNIWDKNEKQYRTRGGEGLK